MQTALQTAVRLESTENNIHTRSTEHGSIIDILPNWDMLTLRSDLQTPKKTFNNKYKVIIPERNFYDNIPPPIIHGDTESWYTDGSKTQEGTGLGIYGPNTEIWLGFDDHASVFQTEVLAISRCAEEILRNRNSSKNVNIYSDSQAALLALINPDCYSKIVEECKRNLNKLGDHHKITILWIPGHAGLPGNEKADELARKGSASTLIGTSPSLPIGLATH